MNEIYALGCGLIIGGVLGFSIATYIVYRQDNRAIH